MTDIPRVDWHGCYDGSWQGELVPDAFAHPAKIPFALAERIYRHMLAEGWITQGEIVVDPFGGIAGTAFHALLYGLHWQGVELEPKFVALAEQNIALWNERYAAHMPNWGSATIRQGDSRKLASILADAQASVSSPPYAESAVAKNSTSVDLHKQYETYRAQGGGASFEAFEATQRKHSGDYGTTPGQLGALPQGDFEAAVSSPPYSDQATNGSRPNRAANLAAAGIDASKWLGERRCTQGRSDGYGETDGQLGAMPTGDLDAAISSPPYAQSLGDGNKSGIDWSKQADRDTTHPHGWNGEGYAQIGGAISSPPYSETRIDGNGDEGASGLRNPDGTYLRGPDGWAQRKAMGARYGETPGNLGNLPAGVVSSPPYAATEITQRRNFLGGHGAVDVPANVPTQDRQNGYGSSSGNLGNLPAGDHDAAVSSPPYETGGHHDGVFDTWGGEIGRESTSPAWSRLAKDGPENGYGDNPDQVTGHGDTFWSAARTIVEQTYRVLRPGAVAAWVTGDFVRNKQRVPFGEQWLALCESVGFEPLLWAIAWKHEDHGAQLDIFGNEIQLTKSKVSFFRRLANAKNPDAAILNEDVIFVRKPPPTNS